MPPFSQRKTCLLSLVLFGLAASAIHGRPIVALTDTVPQRLLRFDSASPETVTGLDISGVEAGYRLRAIDFRPANGILYGLAINITTDQGRIYMIDADTGVAVPVGNQPFVADVNDQANYGFDFDPVADEVRVVTDFAVNRRVDPDTGEVIGTPSGLSKGVLAAAYNSPDRNPLSATTLFGIDYLNDDLVRIGGANGSPSPDGGVVTKIDDLGIILGNHNVGYDIGEDGVGYASMFSSATPAYALYTINQVSGDGTAANYVDPIGNGGTPILGIAIVPLPVTNATTFEQFGTIQAAINDPQTTNGHALDVNPGTYEESVTVSKPVTIRGAKFGVDARSDERIAFESIIRGAPSASGRRTSFNLTANGAAVDGFTVQDNSHPTQFGAGIALSAAGTRIRNNIIKNNIIGVHLFNNSATAQTVIERNLFAANNKPGAIASGSAIFSDETVSGATLVNVLVNENTFLGHDGPAVNLTPLSGSTSRIVISNNDFFANLIGVYLNKVTDAVIARNTMSGPAGVHIGIVNGSNRIAITENRLGSASEAVRIAADGAPSQNVALACNSIDGQEGAALTMGSGAYTGTLDATGNWWGSETGPTIASNPGGTGEEIVDPAGQVNYAGFLLNGTDQQPLVNGFECSPSAILYGITNNNKLVRFDSADPAGTFDSADITGLQAGEIIVGIDFRPTTGELFAIGSTNRLYVMNRFTAAVTLRGVLSTGLAPAGLGADFNPVPDLIGNASFRVVNVDDENARINANTAEVIFDAPVNPASRAIDAVAYTNVDLDPATGTSLYGYDFAAHTFVVSTNPNAGTYDTVGAPGFIANGRTNLDIQTAPGSRNVAFASLRPPGSATTKLYIVNLTNGLLTPLGDLGAILSGGMAVSPAGTIQLSAPSYAVGESGATATITLNRVGGSEGAVTVRFQTQDGTAAAPGDYTAVDQVVTFASGETSKTVSIAIANDSSDEADETINLLLSAPTGGALVGPSAVLTIVDDPTPALSVSASGALVPGKQLLFSATLAGGAGATGTITFNVYAADDPGCSGASIFTSTVAANGDGTYTSAAFTPARTGTYRYVASYSGDANNNAASTGCGDPGAALSVTPATALGNIATRLLVEAGDNVLIGGITITGSLPKRMLVRAIGPSVGVAGALPDPQLQLFAGDELVTANDNWRDAPNQQEIIDTTLAPPDDQESAILITLNPGQYTAVVTEVNGASGIGLVDAYDLDRTVDSKFANIATRGLVQIGDDVMIAGLIVVGDTQQTVLVRAIGPSLPIEGKLADPTLQLVDANGDAMATNNNWRDDQQAAIEATSIPPPDDLESAILATLTPGQYTAVVRGVEETTGVALVEVYALD